MSSSVQSLEKMRGLAALRRRPAAIVAATAIAAALSLYFTTRGTVVAATPAPAPSAPRVTVAAVEERLLTEFEEVTGRVDAIESVDLRARVSGHVQQVNFQAGQLVKKGDLLFTIDPRWYRAQFDLASAEVVRAQARANIAEREASRADDLFAKSVISAEDAEARRSTRAESAAALLAARAALDTARLDLEHTEVRAPISGRVGRAFVTEGNLASGVVGGATVLTRIVSTGDAYIYADLDEQTVLKFNRLVREGRLVKENGRVPVDAQLGDEERFAHRGYIESVDNRLDPATGSLVVRMVFPNADEQLVPGLFARVRIPVSAPERALLVSERSIGTDQSQKFVLTVSADNKVGYRAVKVGSAIDGSRVVRAGLQPGERVVVNGLQRVRPGMAVEPEVEVAATPVLATGATQVAIAH